MKTIKQIEAEINRQLSKLDKVIKCRNMRTHKQELDKLVILTYLNEGSAGFM